MKTKQKKFLGLAVIIIVIFTITACATISPPPPQYPQEFWGTWKREYPAPQNTLTITANTYKLSHQRNHWILNRISGDTYHYYLSSNNNWRESENIRYVNGTLVIEPCRGTGESQCGGIWIKQ